MEQSVKRNVKYLDSVSTINETERRISISLINKSLEEDIDCTIEIANGVCIKEAIMDTIWSAGIKDYNSAENENVSIVCSEPTGSDKEIRLTIPRHSINVLQLDY